MLMLFMAGGLFLHRLYSAQQKALREARLAAWSQAAKGCQSSIDLGDIWREVVHGGGDSGGASDPLSGVSGFFGVVSHTSSRATQSASASSRIGGGSYSLSASDTIACNEIANDSRGDAHALWAYVSEAVWPKVSF
jgi:hypothetical protein